MEVASLARNVVLVVATRVAVAVTAIVIVTTLQKPLRKQCACYKHESPAMACDFSA